jgi:hypothetical protein
VWLTIRITDVPYMARLSLTLAARAPFKMSISYIPATGRRVRTSGGVLVYPRASPLYIYIGTPLKNFIGSVSVFEENQDNSFQLLITLAIHTDHQNNMDDFGYYQDAFGYNVTVGQGIVMCSASCSDVRGVDSGNVYMYQRNAVSTNTGDTSPPGYTYLQSLSSTLCHTYNHSWYSIYLDARNMQVAIGTLFTNATISHSIGEAFLFRWG